MWARIPNFPDYSVSSHGEVRNDEMLHLLKPSTNQYGVAFVGLVRDRIQYKRGLARLVANAFLPQGPVAFDTPINLDGDRLNCDVENLMWRPRWFAIQYHQQFRAPYRNHVNVPLRDIESGEVHPTSYDAAIRYGLLERDLVLSMLNSTWVWPTYQRFEIVE